MTDLNPDTQQKNKESKAFTEGIIDPCVHCGFCLPTCASYKVLGTEMDSPRGRIHLLKAINNGELELDADVAKHFDTCLGCFACVTACPSGVRYDKLIESTRPLLNKDGLRSPCANIFRRILLQILPYPRRLRAILQTLRGYKESPLQKVFNQFNVLEKIDPSLAAMDSLLPSLSEKNFKDKFKVFNPAEGTKRGRVGLVLGCVQRCFDPDVNHATLAVLQANGFEVIIPRDQGCCGAVAHHQGEIKKTKKLATDLIKSFQSALKESVIQEPKSLEAILIAASGCGHTMKAYGEILNGKIDFNVPVLDVHEFLYQQGLSDNFLERLRPLQSNKSNINPNQTTEVVFHDACHMIHGQGIIEQPRLLLKSIPKLRLLEAMNSGVCCGSAGIYNLVQPEEANELGRIKSAELTDTGAKIIASANIGCSLQIRKHINQSFLVKHPMQLLAESAGFH